jgi:DNA-binding PadR family transcriptional regulator
MDHEKHLPLAPRDLLILSVLAEGPLHGYGIIKAVEIRSESGVLLDPANLYRVLRRMREVGWIEEAGGGGAGDGPRGFSGETPGSESNRESRRKTYRITTIGQSLLKSELARLERLLRFARPALANASPPSPTRKGA